MTTLWLLLFCFVVSAAMPWLVRVRLSYVPAVLAAGLFCYFLKIYTDIGAGGHVISVPWFAAGGFYITFLLDGVSLLFALLVTGIGALIMIYSVGYMSEHASIGRFLACMTAFMTSMLGLVISGDLITLFVFWELTTITSFLLISFEHDRLLARRAAVQALVITGGGGLALLAGLIWLGHSAQTMNISEIISGSGVDVRQSASYLPILVLILIGAFTKSAQVPFNAWLPNAMQAPTPVSAYLHSATMVKAGIFLLIRLNPAIGGTDAWSIILMTIGGVTLLTGGVLAIAQRDLKQVLAQTTVASLGLLVFLIGTGSVAGMEAALLYLVAHAFFKGALFMVVGAIDHETKTRDIMQVRCLYTTMPILAVSALMAGLSMGGFPPFGGFVAKEVIYGSLLAEANSGFAWLAVATAFAGNILLLATGALVAVYPFFSLRTIGIGGPSHPNTHEPHWQLLLGPVVLASLGLLAGPMASMAANGLLGQSVIAAVGKPVTPHWSIVPHFDAVLLLSLITLGVGSYVMLQGHALRVWVSRRLRYDLGLDVAFDRFLVALVRSCERFITFIHAGDLREYVAWTFFLFAVATILFAWPLYGVWLDLDLSEPMLREWFVFGVIASGAITAATSHSRLRSITALGVTGFGVAILFMMFGAPDLSFTQFMVETLQIVIMAFVLPFLDLSAKTRRSRFALGRDIGIAALVGISVSWVLIATTSPEANFDLSAFFNQHSLVAAHGRNVVNVILVDFRALDTLGEISVVMMAGLAILAMLTGFREKRQSRRSTGEELLTLETQASHPANTGIQYNTTGTQYRSDL